MPPANTSERAAGFGPATTCMASRYSTRLSYARRMYRSPIQLLRYVPCTYSTAPNGEQQRSEMGRAGLMLEPKTNSRPSVASRASFGQESRDGLCVCLHPIAAVTPPGVPGGPKWSQPGSNRRHRACKARALPTELWPHIKEEGGWHFDRRKPGGYLSSARSGAVPPGA